MYKVTVLMSTYNGEKYIKEQIESVLAQKNVEVKLTVRDDGSSDSTTEILEEYSKRGLLNWYAGCNLKPAKSFMDLVYNCEHNEFYAFCDQDDFWFDDKLSSAVEKLIALEPGKPAVYYGSTILTDSNLKVLENQGVKRGPFLTIEQAVISSNATGCTMCFNDAMREVLLEYRPSYQIMHDGWVHKVCIAIGGTIIYDNEPHIYYRQHGNNVIGGTGSFKKRWSSRINRFAKSSRNRSMGVSEILNGYSERLPAKERAVCQEVSRYNDSFRNRIRLLLDSKIKTGDKKIDRMYRIAVLFGKF